MSSFGGGSGFNVGAAPFGKPAGQSGGQLSFGFGGQDDSSNQRSSFGGVSSGGFQAWASSGQAGGFASSTMAGPSTFGQGFTSGDGFGTAGGFGSSFPSSSQFDITPISVAPPAAATVTATATTSASNQNPFSASSGGGLSPPTFGSVISPNPVGGPTPAAPAAPISFGTSSNVVPMPATNSFSATNVFDAGQDSNMSAGDTAWVSIGDEFLGDDHDMESTPAPGSMSPVNLSDVDASAGAAGNEKPLGQDQLDAHQSGKSTPKAAQNDEKDEQLARLKAKIQQKKKKLQEQMKMREASPPHPSISQNPRSPTRSPLTVEDDLDPLPLPEKRSPVKTEAGTSSGDHPGDDRSAALAERNALRFAATAERPLTTFLPADLKGKAKSHGPQAPETTRSEPSADDTDAVEAMVARKPGKSLVGTCPHMCPDEELLRREAEGDIQTLENPSPSDIHPSNWTLRETAVKRFRRSAADYKLDIPELVRPPHVLEQVCGYLEEWVMERDRQGPDKRFPGNQPPPPLDVYQFVWDRTRMIRKDFILQNYIGSGGKCCAAAVRTHERVARWHILCEHQLSHLPEFVTMQSQQNIQELGQTMKTLNLYYDDARRRSTVEEPGTPKSTDGAIHGCRSAVVMGPNPVDFDGNSLDNSPPPADPAASGGRIIGVRPHHSVSLGTAEPEMRALYILVVMDNDGGMEVLKYAGRLCIERPEVYKTKPVQLALSVYKAKKALNYARFFSLLRAQSTPYLFACIMFKYVEHMRKVAFRIMSKTFGMKRRDTGEAAYDTYPMRRLVPLLCFEDAEEAREACRHYNIRVESIPASSVSVGSESSDGNQSVEIVLWRHGDFREPKDPVKGTNIPLRPRKMTKTIEAKLKGATRLAVCRGDVSGEGALLVSHSHMTSGVSVASVTSESEVDQRQTQALQEEAERNRLLILATEKSLQQEMERKRMEQERQREELAKAEQARKKREEDTRRKREEEARRKKEEKEAAAAAAAKRKREEALRRKAEEEARRKKAEELDRMQKEEEARKKRQKEDEERRRREIAEAQCKKEEEARRKMAEERRRREEEERKRKELERRALLEQRRQEEARRKKLAEEEKERQRLLWRRTMDNSKKLLLWKRWVAYAQRHSIADVESRLDSGNLSSRPICLVRSKDTNLGLLHDAPSDGTSSPFTSRLLYQLGTTTERINLAALTRDGLLESGVFVEEYEQFKRIRHLDMFSTVLFKVGLVVTGKQDKHHSHEVVSSWLRSRLSTGSVLEERVRIASINLCVKTVVVDGTSDPTKLEGSDALLFVIPPVSSRLGCETISGEETLQVLHRHVHRDAVMMVLSCDHRQFSESQEHSNEVVKTLLGENADNEHGLVRTRIDKENFRCADSDLVRCCRSLASSFAAKFSPMHESSTSVARVSMASFGLERLRESLWDEGIEEELPARLREREILVKCQEVVKILIDEVDLLTSRLNGTPLEVWPAKEFENADPSGGIADYFLPSLGALRLSWRENNEVVSSKLKKTFDFIVDNSSLGEMVGSFASTFTEADAAYCQRRLELNQFRLCIEFLLQHWEQCNRHAGLVGEAFLYIPPKLASTLAERVSLRLQQFSRDVASKNRRRLEYSQAVLHRRIYMPERSGTSPAVESKVTPLIADVSANATEQPSAQPFAKIPETRNRTNVGVQTPQKSPAKRNRPVAPDSEQRINAKKQREQNRTSMSRDVMESRAFTRALERLVRGEVTIDVDVGGQSLAELLADCEPPTHPTRSPDWP